MRYGINIGSRHPTRQAGQMANTKWVWETVDDLGKDATVPDWVLSKTEKDKVRETIVTAGDIQLRRGIQPDIVVIIDGRPETEQPPSGRPTKTWTSRSGESIVVNELIIAEVGFTSDMSFPDTTFRKRDKYGPGPHSSTETSRRL
jgi:hypothetical protein